ncbi:hypothetical protein KUTeg_011558 [Tegillarca granosa]|uniref:SWIM-type domain-containing protein n=1 Tax=Tegillarca granosa TaxID=220873 RepID=A0ABQ9EX19_TEGGR|nr:hypothetical protein KUTeg_011558 [Tegillarca granosa]
MAALSLDSIRDDFSTTYFTANFSKKSLSRGLTYYKEGYVHKVTISKGSRPEIDIGGRCYRSMRKGKTPHKLSVTLKNKRHICDAYCSCTAGSGGACSHMVGLVKTIQQFKILGLKDVPSEQACTSLPQTWHIPRGNRITPISVSKVVVTKAKDVRKKIPIIQKPLDCERLPTITDEQMKILKTVEGAPIARLHLKSTPLVPSDLGQTPIGSSQHNALKFNNSESVTCGNTTFPKDAKVKLPPWYNCLKSNPVNSIEIEQTTRGQHNNTDWYRYRGERITASQMHQVVLRKKKPTDALLKSLFSTSTFTCAATEYCITREKSAKAQYTIEKSTNNIHLHDCGLVINNEFPFLAATPDAKVCDKNECGLLEIKCPYAARDMTIPQAIDNINNFVLCRENGVVTINRNHAYYVQIQGQLLVTGAPWCDLAVYTTKDFYMERISPNISFITNMLLKLALFYKYYALPYLHQN